MMKMRLIDADELFDFMCSGCNAGDGSKVCREKCIDCKYIETMPTLKPGALKKYLAEKEGGSDAES